MRFCGFLTEQQSVCSAFRLSTLIRWISPFNLLIYQEMYTILEDICLRPWRFCRRAEDSELPPAAAAGC
jgi:hypothetical protein